MVFSVGFACCVAKDPRSKRCEQSAVNALCIVEESVNDFLAESLAFFGKSRRSVTALGILCFCTVVWFDMWVWLMLWCARFPMAEMSECFGDVVKH